MEPLIRGQFEALTDLNVERRTQIVEGDHLPRGHAVACAQSEDRVSRSDSNLSKARAWIDRGGGRRRRRDLSLRRQRRRRPVRLNFDPAAGRDREDRQ